MAKILITGGAGFIGSNFIHYLLNKYPDCKIVNLDKLTYAGNLDNLKDIEKDSHYRFVKGDICDKAIAEELMKGADAVVNFAAESHADRSILNPENFLKTNILGTYVLLEAAKNCNVKRFIQISTDEVYGSIQEGLFKETDNLSPSSPYSASKASSEMMAIAYYKTYNLPIIITRSSNNFGPYQYPEKIIPLFITNFLENREVPVYGYGLNRRDWIYVLDNCEAIDLVLQKGKEGEIYNIGASENEISNIELTCLIAETLKAPASFIKFVKDRPGHDFRYALNCEKIHNLGFSPKYSFKKGLEETIKWYQENEGWWKKLKSGEYLEYYKKQYSER